MHANTATALLASAAPVVLPADQAAALAASGNPMAATAAAGFGVSLVLIHIYVTPIKRTIQVGGRRQGWLGCKHAGGLGPWLSVVRRDGMGCGRCSPLASAPARALPPPAPCPH